MPIASSTMLEQGGLGCRGNTGIWGGSRAALAALSHGLLLVLEVAMWLQWPGPFREQRPVLLSYFWTAALGASQLSRVKATVLGTAAQRCWVLLTGQGSPCPKASGVGSWEEHGPAQGEHKAPGPGDPPGPPGGCWRRARSAASRAMGGIDSFVQTALFPINCKPEGGTRQPLGQTNLMPAGG